MEQNEQSRMLQVGTVLQGGKYVVKAQLSSGGFGNTYVIVDKGFEDEFALKEYFIKGINERNEDNVTISISNVANTKQFESQKEKFKKEARRLRKLNNRHIIRVYDLFEENNTAYYVMDYIDGESLSSRLKRTKIPLPEAEALDVLSQVLDALEEVHKLRIWHLDLKPANILVDKNGNVVLIDFGASKQLSRSEGYETTTNTISYTPGYAPSEQMDQNMDKIGPWTDFYALGATLYNLVTCSPPPLVSEVQDDDAFQFPSNISEKFKKLVAWMMNPTRALRPQSVSEVRHFLSSNNNSAYENEDTVLDNRNVKPVVERTNIYQGKSNNEVKHIPDNKKDAFNAQPIEKNKMIYLVFGILIILCCFLVFDYFSRENLAQAPVEDTDSIAEVVDSVVDSMAVDSVAADWYDYYQ